MLLNAEPQTAGKLQGAQLGTCNVLQCTDTSLSGEDYMTADVRATGLQSLSPVVEGFLGDWDECCI